MRGDLTGLRSGRLVAIIDSGERRNGLVVWQCQCDCGSTHKVTSVHIKSGTTKSCGCLRVDTSSGLNLSHGHATGGKVSPEYECWCGMKRRCFSPNQRSYASYGGRGITVCDRWKDSFENFLADMGPKLSPRHTIDRIDPRGNYEPSNCRWATWTEQQNNRSNNVVIRHLGISQSLTQWSKQVGISVSTLHKRMKLGWTNERVLTTPLRTRIVVD